jgi:hypothetical protein
MELRIDVQNGSVTITVGGQTLVQPIPQTAPQPIQLGPIKAEHILGPDDGGPAPAGPVPGAAPNQANIDPGGGPGSGVVVIGPIVLSGMLSDGASPQAGAAPNQANIDPGGGPASLGVLVIGPLIITGSGGGSAVRPGIPVNPPAPK